MVNVCQADLFAFSEMLRTAKEVKDRDYKKVFIHANKIELSVPAQNEASGFWHGKSKYRRRNPNNSQFMCQLFRQQDSLKTHDRVRQQLKMTSKDVAR